MSMQPDGMHPRVIRELTSITQMLHHLEAAWWAGKFPDNGGKEANIEAIFKHKDKNLGNYRPVDLSLWESYGASLLEGVPATWKTKRQKKRASIFLPRTNCAWPTSLSYDDMTGSEDKGKAVMLFILTSGKACDIISHSIVIATHSIAIAKLFTYPVHISYVRWVEKWMNCWAQRLQSAVQRPIESQWLVLSFTD